MKLRLLLSSSALLGAVVACSGASDTELFAPATNTNGTDPTASSSSSGDQASSSSGSSTSSSGGSSTSSSGGSSTSSSGGSSTSSSSGSTGPKDAGPPPPPATKISCGEDDDGDPIECTMGTQVCCAGYWNETPTYECKPAGLVGCPGKSKIGCDDTTDCAAGQVCCGTYDDNTKLGAAECRTQCKGFGSIRAGVLCDPDAAVDQCAPFSKVCVPSQKLPGYFTCQ